MKKIFVRILGLLIIIYLAWLFVLLSATPAYAL